MKSFFFFFFFFFCISVNIEWSDDVETAWRSSKVSFLVIVFSTFFAFKVFWWRLVLFFLAKRKDVLSFLLFHTIQKVKFLSKKSILTKPQHFHEFFTQFFFWQFFSWNQSCQQLKSPKPQHFHEFFTQIFFLAIFLVKSKLSTAKKSPKSQHFHEFFTQKINNFHGKSKFNLWTKNEDFE